ncbi:prephenate dehydrogenase/arogenate dehydrogenase family protein [Halococcus dombrowskii]|uniref:Prephenate dehydrogenase/arogenate dehydrogenase family protein n=1 Tax=Halococcus dombrowskii TaxID=179637 RepID=A0AAV3SHL2_HALDO|nr:prephenate dehydrogenase/arogenate dehydrogenase family protein [Halococcus dombrowskii]UOO95919.1 prephenate dehydrogenase/arogenate dehydrogenase family protein [Halococcus dombrowskii]
MTLLVVGAGTMGEWFARTLADTTTVTLTDTDPERATAVADRLDARSVALDTDERFDTVCFAVPMPAVEAAIAEHAPTAERAVIDVTGSMAEPIKAMRTHAPDRERLSLHPLFAPENAPGRIATVADATGPATDGVRAALAAENEPFETTPDEHDQAMETVQAGAHAAVLAYALAAEDVREEFHTPISGPLDGLASQVLSGSPRVYAEIQERFDGAEAVAEAAERIATVDGTGVEELYREAREQR